MFPALSVTKIYSVISLLNMSAYESMCMFVVDIKTHLHLSGVPSQTSQS